MGTAENVLHGIASFSIDSVNIGYTDGGVSIEKTVEIFEKNVDQELDSLDVVPTKYSFTVKTQFAESTLENIQKVWNEPGPIVTLPATKTLPLGYQQTIPQHRLDFVGFNALGLNRTYTLWRAKTVEPSSHSLQKGDKIVIPVSFRCLPDFARPIAQRYGQIVDNLT